MTVGRTIAILQSLNTALMITLKPFVAAFTTDAVKVTQLSHTISTVQYVHYEFYSFFHNTGFSP
jgi:hypothetical protein